MASLIPLSRGSCYDAGFMIDDSDRKQDPIEASSSSPAIETPLPPIQGNFRRGPSGSLRLFQLFTGLALLRWLVRGVLFLLGYRHTASLVLNPTNIEIHGAQHFMGLSLGGQHQILPLAAIQHVKLVGESNLWARIAALVALILAAALGTLLVLWGIIGRQVSWVVMGLGVISSGIFLEALAYLSARRKLAREQATLEIVTMQYRIQIDHVPRSAADQLLRQLADEGCPHWQSKSL